MIPVLRIYDGLKITDIGAASFTSYSVGFGSSCDYAFRGDGTQLKWVELQRRGSSWVARSNLGFSPTTFGKGIWLSRPNKQGIRLFKIGQPLQAAADVQLGVSIGRSPDCSIVIPNERVSRCHAYIWNAEGTCRFSDEKSKNGTYVNGVLTRSTTLSPGDIIAIEDQYFTYDGELILSYIPEDFTEISTRPIFSRSPRLKAVLSPEEHEIEPPPSIGGKPSFNPSTILYPIGGVNYLFQGGKYKKAKRELTHTYQEYIGQLEEELNQQHEHRRNTLLHSDPSPQDCAGWPLARNMRLWERIPTDWDFMRIRVGTGTVPSSYVLKAPKQGLTADRLLDQAAELAQKSRYLHNSPVSCSCRESGFVGIVGGYDQRLGLLNHMILEAAALHSYDELKIVGFMPKHKRDKWEWMRWLPHCFSDDWRMRFLVQSDSDAGELAKLMGDVLERRANDAESSHFQTLYMPFYLFVVADPDLLSHTTLLNHLSKCGEEMQFAVLYLAGGLQQLPKECHTIIEIREGAGCIYDKTSAQDKQKFVPDSCPAHLYDVFARSMAPIRVESSVEDEALPTSVTFLEGFGVKQVSNLDIAAFWDRAQAHKSLSVPIGVLRDHELFYLDIHEKKHGPNGIVAGMVGSGKTEAIQSWILSMSVHFSPLDVNFVLIDFKGTGLLQPFQNLPHIAGMISNLDTNIGRKLRALANENQRRLRLFAKAGVDSIIKYKELLNAGIVTEPLPFLFVIIDEYAQFKQAFPDFTHPVEELFCLGRAQGIYTILMTQKPTGVVTGQMEGNVGFRLCLKVADAANGKEMHCPDAANIRDPGRAYIETKDGRLTQFQSFYCGAPYQPFPKNSLSGAASIASVDMMGRRELYEGFSSKESFSNKREINAVVEQLMSCAAQRSFPPARRVWTEDLPQRLDLNQLEESSFDGQEWHGGREPGVVLGLVDDPASQCQYPLRLDLSSCGHIALYGAPGSGKTTFLQTLAMSVCQSASPEDICLYMMDFGGWSLNMFQLFPHVGGIANDSEEEKIHKLAQLVLDEMDRRKNRFASIGVNTLSAYRQVTGEKLPYILLLVDNFGAVLPTYPGLEDFFTRLTREGGNYGILLVATANSVNAITYRLKSNIKTSLALQLTDQSMYPDIVGKTGGLVPEDVTGRGLVRLGQVLEFQTAMPAPIETEGELAVYVRELGRKMSSVWNSPRPKQIPVMPDVIAFGSIPCDTVAVGLQTSDISPVELDFHQTHCTLISGTPGSGKSNLLQVIATRLSAKGVTIMAFAPSRHSLESIRTLSNKFCVTGEDMDMCIESLIPELQRRKNARDAEGGSDFDEIALIIDDWKDCFYLISNQTAKRLEMIVRIGAGLGIYLAVACGNVSAGTLCSQGEAVINSLVSRGTNILLGESFQAHTAFDADLPYSIKQLSVGKNEGYILHNGKAVRFKTMYMGESR